MSMLLSGCGSNSKKDPITPTPPPATNGYAFKNVTSNLNITAYEKYKIEFQLTQNDFAVPGAPVAMKVFDQHLGSVESNSVVTDENGKGSFSYTPPAVFPETGTLSIVYTDGNISIEAPITLKFNLDESSDGRATTLSIVYESTEYDVKRGMIGHYHVHAVDRKSNLPTVGIPVKFTLVNGVKEFNGEKLQISKGSIYNTDPVTFIDNSINYAMQTKVISGDNLIIFPSEGKTDSSYLGGWNIKSVSDNLTFSGMYSNLIDTTNLTYIIGNEERLLGGDNGEVGSLVIAHVEIVDDITDADGYAYFDIVFDPKLAGHTVSVEAHGDENGRRIGVAQKIGLRWDKISAPSVTTPNSGSIEKVRMAIFIELENGGSEYLIDVNLAPNSFTVEKSPHCSLNEAQSNFNTGAYGHVLIAVNTDGNTTSTGGVDECTVKWSGGMSSLYYEY